MDKEKNIIEIINKKLLNNKNKNILYSSNNKKYH